MKKPFIAMSLLAAIAMPAAMAQMLADFEANPTTSPNGSVVFRQPTFSGSTSGRIETTPNVSLVSATLPEGNSSTHALNISFAFRSDVADPWLRLTTSGATVLPNPTIPFNSNVAFDIWTDRELRIALGVRETDTDLATGANGGGTGGIEWIGVSGGNATTGPVPTRVIAPNVWTTIYFDINAEQTAAFTGTAGLDPGADGKGVLEHLALVPMAGESGTFNIFIDNLQVTNVPEPTSGALLGLGAAFALLRRKKK